MASTFNMPTPTMGQTHFTVEGGGLSWSMGTPSLFSNPGGPFTMNNPTINNFTEQTGLSINATYKVAALSDNTQMKYAKGDFLFAHMPRRSLSTDKVTAYALWNLNYYLESAQEVKELNGGSMPSSHALSEIPTTVEEFCQRMNLLGVIATTMDKKNVRERTFAVTVDKRIVVPYIFPSKNGQTIRVGSSVGLKIGMVDNPYNAKIGLDGRSEGTMSAQKIFQVVGHWEPECNQPIHCSRFGNPTQDDLDFMQDVVIEQRVYPEDTDRDSGSCGLVNFDEEARADLEMLKIQQYTQSHYIHLGKVVRLNKHPANHDIWLGLRSAEGWAKLGSYGTVEIEMEPHTFKGLY